MANKIKQKQNDGKPAFQLVGQQAGTIAQRKFQEMTGDSPRVLQLRAYQEMANNSPQVNRLKTIQAMADGHASGIEQEKENINESPIQGKFIGGAPADALLAINTGMLDKTGDFYFTKFRKDIEGSAESVIVYDAGDTSYDQGRQALSINRQLTTDIHKYNQQQLYGLKNGEMPVSGAEVVSHISTISHELSHARDHVFLKKDISETPLTVIESELKAWAVEAMDAIQVGVKLKAMDASKKKLIDSWLQATPAILDDLWAHPDNEVAERLLRYIIRGVKSRGKLEINEWIRENRVALDGYINKFQPLVANKKKG